MLIKKKLPSFFNIKKLPFTKSDRIEFIRQSNRNQYLYSNMTWIFRKNPKRQLGFNDRHKNRSLLQTLLYTKSGTSKSDSI